MKSTRIVLLALTLLAHLPLGKAAVETGKPAPEFSLKSASGAQVKLSDYKGKIVVLEWLNHGCPFVRKHYDSGNMQSLQEKYTGEGVVWLSVISSAAGKQGYSTPEKALKDKNENKSKASAILLDTDGAVGRLYGAKVTPHMFIVNMKGELAYQGAIDSIPSTEVEDVKEAQPFVAQALNSLRKGELVKVKESKAYGCTVKY